MSETDIAGQQKSLVQSLQERRVPQITAFYLGGGWGLIQFIEWIVERYGLSPYLPDFSLIILFSMLPTVIIVAYFHGRPGTDKWTKIEMVTIPVNLMITVGLLFSIFSGKDLGAATKTLIVENEKGETIERVIAKQEFHKKITLFNIKNDTGDSNLDWLEDGLPMAVHVDLMQDIFIFENSQLYNENLYDKIKRAGFPKGVKLPLTLMKKIANEMHDDYFLVGNLTKENEQFIVKTQLYDTELGNKITENTFSSTNVISLVDSISIAVKHDLKLPDYRIDAIQDLPVVELITENIEAYKNFILGNQNLSYHNNYQIAADYLQQSVDLDPTFAMAHFFLGVVYANDNNSSKSIASLKKAMKFDYKFSPKFKFQTKDTYYIMTGQGDKRLNLVKMQTKLNPDSFEAHLILADLYSKNGDINSAINTLETIRRIAPEPDLFLDDIGLLYLQLNKTEKALEYIKNYATIYSTDVEAFNQLARIYRVLSQDDLAVENYQKALFLDESNMTAMLSLAEIDVKYGRFEKAYKQYQSALMQVEEPRDKYRIYLRLVQFHKLKGQPIKVLESAKNGIEFLKLFSPPLNVSIMKLANMGHFILAGEKEQAFALLSEVDNELKSPFDTLTSIGYAQAYIQLKDLENANKQVNILIKTVDELRSVLGNGLDSLLAEMTAEIAELEQDYTKAIDILLKDAEKSKADHGRFLPIGKLYRLSGNLDDALIYLQKQLVLTPNWATAHHEMGLIFMEREEQEKAVNHLQKAAEIWQEADEIFEPAKENKKLLEQLLGK